MNIDELKFNKAGSNTDKHKEINNNAVPAFPLFETFTVFWVLSTNNPPMEIRISLITSRIKKLILSKMLNFDIKERLDFD